MCVLITAGATRNPLDAIRYLSAHSTGTTGVHLARSWVDRGLEVHLLASPEAELRAPELSSEGYGSTRDLMARMETWVRANPSGAVVHAAAVGDYEAAESEVSKIPSRQAEWVLRLKPAPKIADRVRGWGLTGAFVTFKAASPETTDDELVGLAQRQRERTGSDWVFANRIGALARGVWLVGQRPRRFEARADGLAALVEAVAAHGQP